MYTTVEYLGQYLCKRRPGYATITGLSSQPRRFWAKVPVNVVKAYLRSVQREQVSELCSLLNRTFPEWKSFHDTDSSLGSPEEAESMWGRNAMRG
jgi:hypothetical protein